MCNNKKCLLHDRDLEQVKSLRPQFTTWQQGKVDLCPRYIHLNNVFNQLMYSNRIVYPVPFVSPDERVTIQAAIWSPRNNALVYCRQNDIYYIPDVTIDQTERLTSDGSFNAISNGIPDWTYRGIIIPAILQDNLFHLRLIVYRNVQPTSSLVLRVWWSIIIYYLQRYCRSRDKTTNLQWTRFVWVIYRASHYSLSDGKFIPFDCKSY